MADVTPSPELHKHRHSLARVWQLLLRLPFVLGRLALELLPVFAFIGLASAFRIVQLHNGSIDFTSEVGRGTTFRIELPLAA